MCGSSGEAAASDADQRATAVLVSRVTVQFASIALAPDSAQTGVLSLLGKPQFATSGNGIDPLLHVNAEHLRSSEKQPFQPVSDDDEHVRGRFFHVQGMNPNERNDTRDLYG